MDIAWRPTERYLARSRLRRFAEQHGHGDFASLYRWSVQDLEGFWRAVDCDLGLVWQAPYERVLDTFRGRPARARRPSRRPRGHFPSHDPRMRDRDARRLRDRRDLHADLLGVRR